ncbi:MAG: molybdopterin cofactor-binding domain-containing protein, partial [Bryobacteraceae bacterium]
MNNPPLEPERYELYAAPPYKFELDRRDFFRTLGAGFVVVLLARDVDAQESGGRRRGGVRQEMPREIIAWLHIGENGYITVFTGKVEVGQNIRTSLAQAVAGELRVPLDRVNLVMGDTALTPFDMGTFGSRTTPTMAPELRKAAATARQAMIAKAAAQWGVEASTLKAADGKVEKPGSRESLSYGQLGAAQTLLKEIASDTPLTPASEWTVAGHSAHKAGEADFATGRHRYPSDIARPGMLYGRVLRPPSFGATLASFDSHAAEAMAGVTAVRDGDFAGVVAHNSRAASLALAALKAQWNPVSQPSGADLFKDLKSNTTESRSGHSTGALDGGFAAADHKLEGTYTVAYIAHAPLEPRAAVAEWNGNRLTVWTGTQRPFGVRTELAEAFHLPEDSVHVLMPDTGAAYGGKHTGEAAVEAARLAKAAGKPVKLVWTREEEFTWAYFRPAGLIEISSGVANGSLTAWKFDNYNSGPAAIQTPYDVANQKIEFHPSKSPLRQGSYRGLASTANVFARETHMDELAHSIGMDPLAFRLKNLSEPRLRTALETAAERFGWGKQKPGAGRGFGVAAGTDKGGYVATCAEVEVGAAGAPVRVVRVVQAFECGAIVNPDQLKNQVQGAIMMGIGGALYEAIKFDNGRILNAKFSLYQVPRF